MPANSLGSSVYVGNIRHRRFGEHQHSFNYSLYMLALDVDEMTEKVPNLGIFGEQWYRPVRFVEKDYVKSEPGPLKTRITNKVSKLGGKHTIAKVVMLVQARCLGLYFSPANFYFCYDEHNNCTDMLVEVSNTPWNERHYYLVDVNAPKPSDKDFHVSPFMDLNMQYHWRVKPPEMSREQVLVHIENWRSSSGTEQADKNNHKVFEASLAMKKQGFSQQSLWRVWCTLPAMTLKVVAGIYWQALTLFIKRVPFIGHPARTK
ncbi:DUF1365 domain-containing protein [Thalassotalea sp. PLHSN55]|uniref:DUF1365 domain-containing protein n=1 Tax=Thalassotalea sp. PLHSN55 TaxID=3435888 RepID=UPI003F87EEF4